MALPAILPTPIRREEQAISISGTLLIPALNVKKVELRYRLLENRDSVDPQNPATSWPRPVALKPAGPSGYYQIDVNTLGLADGTYEYEFLVDDDADHPIADPFAVDLEKFGGYRGVFHIENGRRVVQPFSWAGELPQGTGLPNNNQIVIYEMPVHWMWVADEMRQIGLGTFEKIVFEHLRYLSDLGINAIELLPIQDSADTLNWGYGTRFFRAPDWDMGTSMDLKVFVKCCHRLGIRVILDVVMNHSRECPLERLARDWYYLQDDEEPERDGWGGVRFRYATAVDGSYPAREFQYEMAKFWVREYHVDGFRIDEFKGIGNWDFLQGFRENAWAEHERLFSGRPFIVIAEDSWRRAEITQDNAYNNKPLADSMWNFAFRDELRRLLRSELQPGPGQPGPYDRIQNMISGRQLWNDLSHHYKPGFSDMAKAVNYITSHDVEKQVEERLMNFFLYELLRQRGLARNAVETETELVKRVVDNIASQPAAVQTAHADALDRIGSAFALMLTSVGVPMFIAGEEFGDAHDLEHTDWRLKQTDPVNYARRNYPGHRDLLERVRQLIRLRSRSQALQRNEVQFFYSHPEIDNNDGVKVFAYCRTAGEPLGSANQVVVLANTGPLNFYAFEFPWPWGDRGQIQEHGAPLGAMRPHVLHRGNDLFLSLSLAPFQVRVLTT